MGILACVMLTKQHSVGLIDIEMHLILRQKVRLLVLK